MKSTKRRPRYNPGIEDDPTGGIWYYVWLKPKWELVISHDENKLHSQMWIDHVVPLLKKRYKLKSNQVASIEDLPYSMPRGRVVELLGRERGNFAIYHGDDFPDGTYKASELKKIVAYFGLTNRLLLKQVKIDFDDHEIMVPEEQEDLESIIGPVPYGD